jgi:transposase
LIPGFDGALFSAMHAITIRLDLAKHWFQVHWVDAARKIVVQRRLRRAEVVAFLRAQEPWLVGMEACATAHHWARGLIALGHEVRLMPQAYVKRATRTMRRMLQRSARRLRDRRCGSFRSRTSISKRC